jgi:hypothetical protein
MIQLHPDYLLFETPHGQIIPCSAELVAVELIGEAVDCLDSELVRQAAAGVLHYFKQDLGRETVSVGEFTRALEQALHSLGVQLGSAQLPQTDCAVQSFDLRELAGTGKCLELGFFQKLREELHASLDETPKVLRFHGLRGCVKQLTGARRWTHQCQTLNDQIVGYLRACLETESPLGSWDLVIQ